MKVPTDISTFENDLKEALIKAKTELGYSKREMKVLQAVSKACGSLTRVSFHDWSFETNNQAMLYDGLHPEYRMAMPISHVDSEEMNVWPMRWCSKLVEEKKQAVIDRRIANCKRVEVYVVVHSIPMS
eukprot:scaffold2764_cov75-Skeletonema_marinoi.AAC.3